MLTIPASPAGTLENPCSHGFSAAPHGLVGWRFTLSHPDSRPSHERSPESVRANCAKRSRLHARCSQYPRPPSGASENACMQAFSKVMPASLGGSVIAVPPRCAQYCARDADNIRVPFGDVGESMLPWILCGSATCCLVDHAFLASCCDAVRTARAILAYPVQRQWLPFRKSRTSSSVGWGISSSSFFDIMIMPGVQYPH